MISAPPYVRLPMPVLVLWILAGAVSVDAWSDESAGFICDQQYALCTSAPCIPDPRDPEKTAICDCVVQPGLSFGMTECSARRPRTSSGVKLLTSTYSFAQYRTKATMTCPSGAPWTFCLDKPCTVDPMNRLRAICACDIHRTKVFVTLGGACDTLSCDTGYWSAATLSDVRSGGAAMAKALGLDGPPDNACYLKAPAESQGQ
jgi:hypothetical protein